MTAPFAADADSIAVSVTSTASTSAALPNVGNVLRIVNEGTNIAFFSVGTGTQTAVLPGAAGLNTATAVLPGTDVVFSIANPQPNNSLVAPTPLNFSAICRAAVTTTLIVQVGEGQ